MDNQPQWLHNAILDGLSKLLCLGLDRTPAADLIAGTAMIWVEAVTLNRVWDQQRDAGRLRTAFAVLARESERWPVPKEFLAALPAIESFPMLERKFRPASREEAERAMAEIAKEFGSPNRPMPKAATEPKVDLSSMEAELRRHYDGKRSAAGDLCE